MLFVWFLYIQCIYKMVGKNAWNLGLVCIMYIQTIYIVLIKYCKCIDIVLQLDKRE